MMALYSDDPSLDELMSDEKLRFAFQTFLKRNHMSEILEIWEQFEHLRLETDDALRISIFRTICENFVLSGCPKPVNLSCEVYETLTQLYSDLDVLHLQELPMKLLKNFEHDLFALLEVSCLPSFLLSPIFQEVRSGVFMTHEDEFSRQKAEYFFGMKIDGPIKRQELLRVMPVKEKRFLLFSKKTGKSIIVQSSPAPTLCPAPSSADLPRYIMVEPSHPMIFSMEDPCIDGEGSGEVHGAGTVGLWDLVAKDLH
jgi:hypothetical protein